MRRALVASLLLVGFTGPTAIALSIHVGDATSTMPFELTYSDLQSPLEIVLQVANDTDADAFVLAWQLELRLRPRQSSVGSLQFQEVGRASQPLFGDASAPDCDPGRSPPSDWIFCQDMDDSEDGEVVPYQETREIVKLTITASSDAAGEFQLTMLAENPDADSSWFDNAFNSWPFENTHESDFSGFVLLGTIHVPQLPRPPGDYNGDRFIDSDDYLYWREHFGLTVENAGDGADGNEDNIVDVADYVIWRAHFDGSLNATSNLAAANVPEPASVSLFALGAAAAAIRRPATSRFRSTTSAL